MLDKELKSCPFCGSDNVEPAALQGFPVSVRCVNCGATGPDSLTGRSADHKWNTRFKQPIDKQP